MNKKAFTLTQIVAVITVLGLLSILVAPTIINQIRNSQDKIDEVTEKLIFSATDLYLSNKESMYPKTNGRLYCISLEDLVNDGKLQQPLIDSNGNEIQLSKKVSVGVKNNQYNYSFGNDCVSNSN